MVIANIRLEKNDKKKKIININNNLVYDTDKLKDENIRSEFQLKLAEKLDELGEENLKSWSQMREIYHKVSLEVLGKKQNQNKSKNEAIENLSNMQKKLRLEIDSETNMEIRKELRCRRNKILRELHKNVEKEREDKELDKIKDIERAKNYSNKMFKAVREIHWKNKREKINIKENDKFLDNEKSVAK